MRAALAVLLLTGCAGTAAPIGSPARCANLDDTRAGAGLVGLIGGGASAAGGTVMVVEEAQGAGKDAKIATAVVTASLGLIGGAAAGFSSDRAGTYRAECSRGFER